VSVRTRTLHASFDLGRLTSLTDLAGHAYVRPGAASAANVVLHRESSEQAVEGAGGATSDAQDRTAYRYASPKDLPGATATSEIERDEATGDLAVTLGCHAPQKAVTGIEWRIGPIPADMNIIVPGYGGIKLTAHSSTTSALLEYPMFWEAQLVVVEGQGRGFYAWADDVTGRYKRLAVTLSPDGWWIGFTTWNNAPFADLDECRSVKWRVNVYEGDWRVPARRYREWARRSMPPVAAEQPAWVKDIRCVVIVFDGPDSPTVDMLATRVDPRQTLLYVPDWRPEGYDRLYPNYEPVPAFGPFVQHAHALGFRVMPHLNHFAIDPQNPIYGQFQAHHIRDAWGTHEQQWFVWDDPSNPANNRKLAYINPAYRPWRDLLIARIRKLRNTYGVDAVYLDQTLNIYNDYNGLCDGATMLQGNLALGREIRAAMPDLAVGGEGLDEVTARYQDFCQRHAWGIDFARSSWNKPQLKLAHPISTYLFRPTLTFNYLGVPPPSRAQFYAAWRENLVRWGALPTLMAFDSEPKPQTGFLRQLFDEVKFWQAEGVDADMDGPWPEDVVFPCRTARGRRAARMTDGSLMFGDREISRTVTGVTEVRLPGTIEGALCYDRERIFGLNPDLWYPYFAGARDLTAFHVESLPPGVPLKAATLFDGLAILTAAEPVVARLPEMMAQATTGSILDGGAAVEVHGPLNGDNGSQFAGAGDQIHAHPPWKTGTGIAYARWNLTLPRKAMLRFVSKVGLDPAVVAGKADGLPSRGIGRSDGVLFGVTARHSGETRHAGVFNSTAEGRSLELDLSAFAGQQIALELTVDPGPARNVTADWARWYGPRVVEGTVAEGRLVVVDPARQALVLSGTKVSAPKYVGDRGVAEATFPGTVMILRDTPTAVSVPVNLAAIPFRTGFTDYQGQVLTAPPWAAAAPGVGVVGGAEHRGLQVQPPDLGQTTVAYALSLPAAPAKLHCFLGLQDGSTSTGVDFIVQANGTELARWQAMPGDPWREVAVDLSPWAGKPVVLSLVTDSDGPFGSDWARWGEPFLLPK
jgi:hypothetical protein